MGSKEELNEELEQRCRLDELFWFASKQVCTGTSAHQGHWVPESQAEHIQESPADTDVDSSIKKNFELGTGGSRLSRLRLRVEESRF
jgi:hypothetical protein